MPLGSTLAFEAVRAKIVNKPARSLAPPPLTFGNRHLKVARLVAEGFTYKEIAAELGFSHGTVRVYVTQIYKLTGFTSPVEVADWVRGRSAHDAVRILKAWGVAA